MRYMLRSLPIPSLGSTLLRRFILLAVMIVAGEHERWVSCLNVVYAAPLVQVVLKPSVKHLTYSLNPDFKGVYIKGTVQGERGESISEASVQIEHPCFTTVQVRSGFEGEIIAQLPLSAQRSRSSRIRDRVCNVLRDHITSSRLGDRIHLHLLTSFQDRSSPSEGDVAPIWVRTLEKAPHELPQISVKIRVAETVLNSAHTLSENVSYKPMRFEMSLAQPVVVKDRMGGRHIDIDVRGFIERHPLMPPKESGLTLTAELLPLIAQSTMRASSTSDVFELSDDAGRWSHRHSLAAIAYGQYRVRVTLSHRQSAISVLESAPIEISPSVILSVDQPQLYRMQGQVVLRGRVLTDPNELAQKGEPATDTLDQRIARREGLMIGVSWRLRSQDDQDLTLRGVQRSHLIQADQSGIWSQTFLLPRHQEAQFKIQLLQRNRQQGASTTVDVSAAQRRATRQVWGDAWYPRSRPHVTPWIRLFPSWLHKLLWIAGTLILLIGVFFVFLRRRPRASETSKPAISTQDALEVSWAVDAEIDQALERHDDMVRVVIYDALSRLPIGGQIYLTSSPRTILTLSGYEQRVDQYQRLTMSDRHQRYEFTSRGLWLSVDDITLWGDQSLWVIAPGYEPLFTAVPVADSAERGQLLVLPLWPAREALGRMWGELLRGLEVPALYGRGRHADVLRDLSARGGASLVAFGEEIDATLYAQTQVSTALLLEWSIRMAEVSERHCPQWSPYLLTPPSDLDRDRAALEDAEWLSDLGGPHE